MNNQRPWRLFHRTILLFVVLGVGPTLCLALAFAAPVHWQIGVYKTFSSILLIISTISTLCLAGLVVRLLKQPIQQLLDAQRQMSLGNLEFRLPLDGSFEHRQLCEGFNQMAAAIALATEREKQRTAEQAFAKLASQVVHDLRSPLTSLEVAVRHVTAEAATNPVSQKVVELLKLSTNRLRSIAEELLQEKKSTTPELMAIVTDLHEVMRQLASEYQARYESGQLHIATNFAEETTRVAVPQSDVQRVIGNILTNAIEAMQAVGQIAIHTTVAEQRVKISLADTGPGMTPEILQRVLQGGFTHGKKDGNGIGMSVVREVIEKYHGTLRADSVVGRGTTFVIEWPLLQATV